MKIRIKKKIEITLEEKLELRTLTDSRDGFSKEGRLTPKWTQNHCAIIYVYYSVI